MASENQKSERVDEGSASGLFDLESYLKIPCLVDSLAISGATSTAFAAHTYRKHRSLLRMGDKGIGILCATAVISWSFCRLQEKRKETEEKKELVQALKKMTQEHQDRRKSEE